MIKKKQSFFIKHLKNNSGDGYIWILVMTVLFLVFFGAMFGLIQTTVSMKDIRHQVDNAADEIFADIKENPYDLLSRGSLSGTDTTVSDYDVTEIFAAKLRGELTPSLSENTYIITVKDIKGRVSYTIKNIHVAFVDRLTDENNIQNTYGCDINGNSVLDDRDINLMSAYISGESPINPKTGNLLTLQDVDVNHDNVADQYDINIAESLIRYFNGTASMSAGDGKGTSGMLIISFEVTVQMRYGVMNYGETSGIYSYPMLISIKSAAS